MGFMIGLGIFLLYVQAFEQFNNKILFRNEIENKTSVPVIGEIVQTKGEEAVAITEENVLLLLNNSGHCERTWPLWFQRIA